VRVVVDGGGGGGGVGDVGDLHSECRSEETGEEG
jgi:hypothetical protein